ncbi:hypothetical protein OCU04_008732 [Sclerotinia nivalis]|uniref:Uncharacterized protein n=1 Tax=Sclerotinia nivalis TaxID=352851 RepID=A0A9X0DG20_9HELO|nr:hypothetical protein OCU04_008732 [Sclerotinia nivalis]
MGRRTSRQGIIKCAAEYKWRVRDAESARSDAAAKTMADRVTIAKIPAQNHACS